MIGPKKRKYDTTNGGCQCRLDRGRHKST